MKTKGKVIFMSTAKKIETYPPVSELARYEANTIKIKNQKMSEDFKRHVEELSKPEEFGKLFEEFLSDDGEVSKK